jgi:hypothetical protein
MQASKKIFLLNLCFLTSLLPLEAQMLSNQGQLIYIAANTTVTVEGSISNEGDLTNNGTLSVSGSWDNRLNYSEGTGTVVFNGSTQQLIKHNNQNFYRLQLAGSGEKILQSNASVTHELILTSGLLTPMAENIFLTKEKAVITGGSTQSYINGRLCRESGVAAFFPIGKNGNYKPVSLDQIRGISPVIGFEVFEPNINAQAGEDLQEVSQVRYWQQTMLSGSVASAFISLSYDGTENIRNTDSIVAAEADQPGSVYRSLGKGSVNGTVSEGTITGKLPVTGKIFAIGIPAAEISNIVYVPNVFSPLAHQEEDRMIKVYGKNISPENMRFSIYNRWGNLIFDSSSFEEIATRGWNGDNKYTGKPEVNGVYTYTLEGKFNNGKILKKVGTITLIR